MTLKMCHVESGELFGAQDLNTLFKELEIYVSIESHFMFLSKTVI
jgi:hypothetical protein